MSHTVSTTKNDAAACGAPGVLTPGEVSVDEYVDIRRSALPIESVHQPRVGSEVFDKSDQSLP